jgi:hypothetical protein
MSMTVSITHKWQFCYLSVDLAAEQAPPGLDGQGGMTRARTRGLRLMITPLGSAQAGSRPSAAMSSSGAWRAIVRA